MRAAAMKPVRHGVLSSYTAGGCRCEVCRAAFAEYCRSRYQTKKVDPLAPKPEAAIAARIAEVFADQDAARMRELDELIRRGGTCRYCSKVLTDASLERHPGVCGTGACRRRAEAEVLRERGIVVPRVVAAAAPSAPKAPRPRGRRPEPCPACGSKAYRHRNGCPESWAEATKADRKAVA